jgi:aminoglycoside 6'-N-acetyltransferase I
MNITIRPFQHTDIDAWLRMASALWPDWKPEDLRPEVEATFNDPKWGCFVALRPDGSVGGFIEIGWRNYADGCLTKPVSYIEGWFVDPDLRGQGVGAALVQAGEDWARAQGYTEMASDTWLENEGSIRAHLALGYKEAERLVHFCKKL